MTIQKQEEQRVKEHLTFTEIGKRLGRDRTAITKEVRNYSVEQDTGYSVFAHNICKYRKGCRRKKVFTHRFKPPYVCNGCRTDFADIQNKKECGGNRLWQRRFLRNWAADTSGKEIT